MIGRRYTFLVKTVALVGGLAAMTGAAPGQILRLNGDGLLQQLPPLPTTGHGFASDVSVPGPLSYLVEALRSPEFAKREAASQALLRLGPERLSDVQIALAKETDSEAAARLAQVAMHLYLKARTPLEGNTSLLGIKLSLELVRLDPKKDDLQMSVAVAELEPGFPAAQTLQVGDRMIAIDGKRFSVDMGIDEFRGNVTSRLPGSIVNLTVVRGGKIMEVPVQLGGVGQAMNLNDAIEQRGAALDEYLKGMKTGEKNARLMVQDPSAISEPQEPNIDPILLRDVLPQRR